MPLALSFLLLAFALGAVTSQLSQPSRISYESVDGEGIEARGEAKDDSAADPSYKFSYVIKDGVKSVRSGSDREDSDEASDPIGKYRSHEPIDNGGGNKGSFFHVEYNTDGDSPATTAELKQPTHLYKHYELGHYGDYGGGDGGYSGGGHGGGSGGHGGGGGGYGGGGHGSGGHGGGGGTGGGGSHGHYHEYDYSYEHK